MSGSGIEWTPGAEWAVAEPEEAGFDRSRLAHAAEWQANDADGQPYAVLIARHGRIVAEWNFRIDPLEPARMASASKSLYSSVLGVAIGEGVIRSADDRVVDYYPELMDVPPGRGPKDGTPRVPSERGHHVSATHRQHVRLHETRRVTRQGVQLPVVGHGRSDSCRGLGVQPVQNVGT